MLPTNMRAPAVSRRSEIWVVAALLLFCPLRASSQAWVPTADPVSDWRCVASSADGSKLVAGNYLDINRVYTSTNAGASWSGVSLPVDCSSAASSGDGNKLAVVGGVDEGFGMFMISTDAGASWSPPQSGPSGAWSCVAISACGTTLVAGGYTQVSGTPGPLAVSTNWGLTPFRVSPVSAYWSSVASSSDGMKLVAVEGGLSGGAGLVYTSTNSGATWAPTGAPRTAWISVASCAEGNRLAAAVYKGPIYTSTNSGVTWDLTGAPITNWMSVASSADGGRIAAAVYNGGIYTSQMRIAPRLSPSPSMAGLIFSWIVPSMKFVLQRNGDLSSTNWASVATAPTFDCKSLKYNVTIVASGSSSFYRLVRLIPPNPLARTPTVR